MTEDFDSDFDLPRPTKLILAKKAFAGSAVTVAVVGALLTIALDSFRSDLANVGLSAPSFLSFPTLGVALAVLFALSFLGYYYALTHYVRRHIFQLSA
jgi:hypothetical protein